MQLFLQLFNVKIVINSYFIHSNKCYTNIEKRRKSYATAEYEPEQSISAGFTFANPIKPGFQAWTNIVNAITICHTKLKQ